MNVLEIWEIHAHHSGAHCAAPARRRIGRRMDASIAEGLLGCREREAMRAIRELEQLPVIARVGVAKALDLGRDAHRKPARVEQANRGDAAPAREQRVPGRGDIAPHRRDQPYSGHCDPAPLGSHGASPAAISMRAVAAGLPPRRAPKDAVTVPLAEPSIATSSATTWPGAINDRIFTSVTRTGLSGRLGVASAASSKASRIWESSN